MIKLGCGNCGNDSFKIYQLENSLVAICKSCKSETVVKPSESKLVLDFSRINNGVKIVGIDGFPEDKALLVKDGKVVCEIDNLGADQES